MPQGKASIPNDHPIRKELAIYYAVQRTDVDDWSLSWMFVDENNEPMWCSVPMLFTSYSDKIMVGAMKVLAACGIECVLQEFYGPRAPGKAVLAETIAKLCMRGETKCSETSYACAGVVAEVVQEHTTPPSEVQLLAAEDEPYALASSTSHT